MNVTETVAPGLPQVGYSSVAWADFDKDGLLDFLITGSSSITMSNIDDGIYNGSFPTSQLWRNTGSGFTNVTAALAPGLPDMWEGWVAWGDYDNDGRPDFLITGYSQGGYISQIWRNTGSGFSNVTDAVAPGLPGVHGSSVAWGDFDNDGRLDFLITGHAGYGANLAPIFISQIWRNTGSGFTNVTDTVAPGLPGVMSGSVAWGDYDNDGRLDFLITGGIPRRTDLDDDVPLTAISQLWRNTGSGFVNVTDYMAPTLPGVFWSSVAWADYDNDGRLDFVLTGYNRTDPWTYTEIWRNTPTRFVNVTATVAPGLPPASYSSVAWGDYDNDGRLDLLLTGQMPRGPGSQIWRNTESGFTNVTATVAPGLANLVHSSVAWGDYDNDGRLDFLLTGAVWDPCDVCDPPGTVSQLWRNQTTQTNPAPVVVTKIPSSATPTNATLTGAINPYGQSVTVWFVWGDTTNCDNSTPAQPIGNGNSFSNFSQTISGLRTHWGYLYRAMASNDQGQVFVGALQEFLLTEQPDVMIYAVSNVTANSATLNGIAYTYNIPTYAWFEWGAATLDHVTPVQFLGEEFYARFGENIFGLEPGGVYYYRVAGSNILGVTYTQPEVFYTPITNAAPCPGSVSPESRWHGNGGGSGYSLYYSGACNGYVISTNSWITITSATNGIASSGRLYYNLAPNPDPLPRSGTIVIGGNVCWITQKGGHPIIVTQPTNQTVFAGGTATFSVGVIGASPTFRWRFNGDPLFDGNGISGATTPTLVLTDVQVSQAGGYQVEVGNSAGHTYSVAATLSVLCMFNLSAGGASFDSLSATGSVNLTSIAPTCPWSVVNTNPWVVLLSSITNRGGGTVLYAVAANPSTTARTGKLIIADQIYTITQAGGVANTVLSLEEAVDTEGVLSWSTIGTPAWFGQTLVSHDGVDAAQSGPITNNSAVTAVSTISGPGTLSFWWKVSSETNKDYLKFFVNGVQQTRISGETDWQLLSYTFPSGTYTSKWTYSKNDQGTVGNDRGWLDQVSFAPGAGCIGTLSHGTATHSSASETGQVGFTLPASCAMNAISLSPWITNIVDASNGLVHYIVATNSLPFSRTGVVAIAGQPFTVVQEGAPLSCAYAISPTSRNHGFGAEAGVVAVTAYYGCEWSVINTNNWVTILSSARDSGSGQVNYSVSANTAPFPRYGYIQIDAQLFQVWQYGKPPCSYSLSPINRTFGYRSTTDIVSVISQEGCAWTAVSMNDWVTLTSATNGSGNGSVAYSVSPNTNASTRDGKILIGNQYFTISQSGAPHCTYSISPLNPTPGPAAGTGTISVTTQSGCAWSVLDTNSWITITSSLTNSGSGTVTYSVAQNASHVTRSGVILVAGQSVLVSQSGAPLSLVEALDIDGTPLSIWSPVSFSPQTLVTHDGVDAAQAEGTAGFTMTVNGPGTLSFWWKISSVPDSGFRFLFDGSFQAGISGQVDWEQRTIDFPAGPQTFQWFFADNGSGGLAWVDQVQFVPRFLCPVTLSPTNAAHSSSSASGSVNVAAAADCTWNVYNTNYWVTVFSGADGSGNGQVLYSVSSNPTPVARSGNLMIGDQNFFISQSATTNSNVTNCNIAVIPGSRFHGSGAATTNFTVAAGSTCNWTVVNTNGWISNISPLSGAGTGIVTYAVAANPTPFARSGNIRVGTVNFLVTQTGVSNGCSITIAPASRAHGYASATGTVVVTTQGGCPWNVLATNSWISIVSSINNSNSGTVVYSITANTNTQARAGYINIGVQRLFLTQAGVSLSGTNETRLQVINQTGTNTTLFVQGDAAKTYVVECSEDLIHWIPISTNSAPSTVTDAPVGNANGPRRFYRTVEVH